MIFQNRKISQWLRTVINNDLQSCICCIYLGIALFSAEKVARGRVSNLLYAKSGRKYFSKGEILLFLPRKLGRKSKISPLEKYFLPVLRTINILTLPLTTFCTSNRGRTKNFVFPFCSVFPSSLVLPAFGLFTNFYANK